LKDKHNYTTIVIAHRLTTIRNADQIAVVDRGEIIELGNHDELLDRNGIYAQLWKKQQHSSGSNDRSQNRLLDSSREESLKVLNKESS
jgi:ABC-type transport system involved in cytochrome bd biosynthesis fused ATPase/permease subunit